MLYGFHDDYGPNRRPLIALVVAVVAVWAVLHLRNPGAPFLSPWREPAAAAAPSGSLSGSFGALSGETVVGSPTISAAKIDAVLASYQSPAAGTGQAMHDLGVKYGIDPQEDQLRGGMTPAEPGYGEDSAEHHGTLTEPDGGHTRIATERGDYRRFYEGIAAAMRDGAPPPVDLADAIAGLELIDRARKSAAEGRRLAVPPL